MRTLSLILLVALSTSAGPKHFLRTHKQEITRAVMLVGIYTAAAVTSMPCHENPTCSDKSPFFPSHPSEPQVFLSAYAVSGTLIALNHALVHFSPDKYTGNLIAWTITSAVTINESVDIKSNEEMNRRLEATRP